MYGDSSNQTQNAEMNCRYNSSLPIIIPGESKKRINHNFTFNYFLNTQIYYGRKI
jgi:hypothetical protein